MRNAPLDTLLDALSAEIARRLQTGLADSVKSALTDAVADLNPTNGAPHQQGPLIRGIDPHALYTARFLAARWSIPREQTIRDIDQALLPRARWHGSGIRYRGADILHYEGCDIGSAAPLLSLGETSTRLPEPKTAPSRARLPRL